VVSRDVKVQAVPEALGNLNWIFLREQDDFEKGVDTLLEAVETDLEWVDAHTNLLEKAIEWEHKGRDKSLLLRGKELREANSWLAQSEAKEPKPTELQSQFILIGRRVERWRQRLTLGAVSFGLIVAVVAFVGLADAGLRVPWGEEIRRALDSQDVSLLRPVHDDFHIKKAAARHRRSLLEALKVHTSSGQWIGRIAGESSSDNLPSVWVTAAAAAAALKIPHEELNSKELQFFFADGRVSVRPWRCRRGIRDPVRLAA
jgi:hypothetical protein